MLNENNTEKAKTLFMSCTSPIVMKPLAFDS